MLEIDHNTLVMVLTEDEGVELVSLGKARDAFELQTDVPHWTSGHGEQYEMIHTNIPKGTMIAASALDELQLNDFDELKHKLKNLDIYPTGHSGDFSGQDVCALKTWFSDCNTLNNNANDQQPLKHTAHQLKPEKIDEFYGTGRYEELVDYLAEEMNIFRHPNGQLLPNAHDERATIVRGLLDGLAQAVRYTRLDAPSTGYQISAAVTITNPNAGDISYKLQDIHKIIVMRKDPKTGEVHITPLDRDMIGKTYNTKDGQPLGNRGVVDLSDILKRAAALQEPSGPTTRSRVEKLFGVPATSGLRGL